MSKVIFVSCDTETTALSHRNGYAWAVGLSAVLVDMKAKSWTVLSAEEYIIPIAPSLWDPGTFEWAKENCGKRLENMLQKARTSKLVPHSALLAAQKAVREPLINFIGTLNKLYEEENIKKYWVFNHPDFDVPFIEQVLPDFKERVGYRNIKDMQSLIEGHMGFVAAKKFMYEHKPEAGIAHTALADAMAQWELLWKSGAIK